MVKSMIKTIYECIYTKRIRTHGKFNSAIIAISESIALTIMLMMLFIPLFIYMVIVGTKEDMKTAFVKVIKNDNCNN